jgi:hypothetical protein
MQGLRCEKKVRGGQLLSLILCDTAWLGTTEDKEGHVGYNLDRPECRRAGQTVVQWSPQIMHAAHAKTCIY